MGSAHHPPHVLSKVRSSLAHWFQSDHVHSLEFLYSISRHIGSRPRNTMIPRTFICSAAHSIPCLRGPSNCCKYIYIVDSDRSGIDNINRSKDNVTSKNLFHRGHNTNIHRLYVSRCIWKVVQNINVLKHRGANVNLRMQHNCTTIKERVDIPSVKHMYQSFERVKKINLRSFTPCYLHSSRNLTQCRLSSQRNGLGCYLDI